IVIGAIVMRDCGLPAVIWSQNLAVAFVFLIILFVAAGVSFPLHAQHTFNAFLLPISLTALGMTFVDADLQGVHRWVQFTHIRLNVAAIVLPIILIETAYLFCGGRPRLAMLVTFLTLGILVAQPDASSATAFGLAVLMYKGRRLTAHPRRFVFGLGVAGLVA